MDNDGYMNLKQWQNHPETSPKKLDGGQWPRLLQCHMFLKAKKDGQDPAAAKEVAENLARTDLDGPLMGRSNPGAMVQLLKSLNLKAGKDFDINSDGIPRPLELQKPLALAGSTTPAAGLIRTIAYHEAKAKGQSGASARDWAESPQAVMEVHSRLQRQGVATKRHMKGIQVASQPKSQQTEKFLKKAQRKLELKDENFKPRRSQEELKTQIKAAVESGNVEQLKAIVERFLREGKDPSFLRGHGNLQQEFQDLSGQQGKNIERHLLALLTAAQNGNLDDQHVHRHMDTLLASMASFVGNFEPRLEARVLHILGDL